MAPILIYVTLDACALLKCVCLTFKILFNSLYFFCTSFPQTFCRMFSCSDEHERTLGGGVFTSLLKRFLITFSGALDFHFT